MILWTGASRINISVPLEAISLYIVHGPTPKAIIERYTSITGRPALPPPWTFDLWLSTSFTTEYDESTVTSFLQGMQDRDISVGVFHFDSYWMKAFQWCDFEFDNKFFPDAKGQLSRLKEKGYKVSREFYSSLVHSRRNRSASGSTHTLLRKARFSMKALKEAFLSRNRMGAYGSSIIGFVPLRFETSVLSNVVASGHGLCRFYQSRCMRVVPVQTCCPHGYGRRYFQGNTSPKNFRPD